MEAPSLMTWIALPMIGGIIGWTTNWIAVKMIFRPIRPRRVLGLRIQGLVPSRQQALAQSIGQVVGRHLVEHQDIVRGLEQLDFEKLLSQLLDKGLQSKLEELRTLPLIGGFLTEERVQEVRKAIQDSILKHKQDVLDELERGLEAGLNVPKLVEEKVAAFPVQKLEELILSVSKRELRAITWLGGLLGVILGLGQVFYLWLLA